MKKLTTEGHVERIRQEMRIKGFSVTTLAEAMGVHRSKLASRLTQSESYHVPFTVDELTNLINILDADPFYILWGDSVTRDGQLKITDLEGDGLWVHGTYFPKGLVLALGRPTV